MAKQSIIERNKKRKKCIIKYFTQRENILKNLKNVSQLESIFLLNEKLQKLPRDSSRTRLRNRCWNTGRARGTFKYFGLCRNAFRNLAQNCLLPGVIKASW